jgi:hypothetical protein
MFKKQSKNPNKAMLKEGLLMEGGGLNAEALSQLNKGNKAINGSDAGSGYSGEGTISRSKSRISNTTHIAGLDNFNKYGDLFQDLTLRTAIDTVYDVINLIITYDSMSCVAIVNKKDEHFEL